MPLYKIFFLSILEIGVCLNIFFAAGAESLRTELCFQDIQ